MQLWPWQSAQAKCLTPENRLPSHRHTLEEMLRRHSSLLFLGTIGVTRGAQANCMQQQAWATKPLHLFISNRASARDTTSTSRKKRLHGTRSAQAFIFMSQHKRPACTRDRALFRLNNTGHRSRNPTRQATHNHHCLCAAQVGCVFCRVWPSCK